MEWKASQERFDHIMELLKIKNRRMKSRPSQVTQELKKKLQMDKRSKYTFNQRRYTDGQKAHEKMLNVTNYQRNTDQNYNEVSPHTSQNVHQKVYKQ